MKKLMVVAIVFAALISSCQHSLPFSVCPMDDTYEYFICTRPQLYGGDDYTDEAYQIMATFADAACTEEPSEWIPAVDRITRESLPIARDFIRKRIGAGTWDEDRLRLHELDLESYHNEKLFPALLGIFVFIPVMGGEHVIEFGDSPFHQSCIEVFEDLRDGMLLEYMQNQVAIE